MFIVLISLVGLITLSGVQINNLIQDLPALNDKFNNLLMNIQAMIFQYAGITPEEQFGIIRDSLNQVFSSGISVAGVALNAASNMVFYLTIVPIYVYFMLYYMDTFANFIIELSDEEQKSVTRKIINNIGQVVQKYISSLSTVIVIVAVLNSIGMLLLGINYAVFFGVLISMLAIIPYFGIMAGAAVAAIYTLLTTDSLWYPTGVLLINVVVQFLEGNFITPNIMGSKLQLNPFAVIIFLFLGSFVWGAVGMILSVPILAITKMICDQIESLKPYGRLLGGV
jgi:predicted PurR-regulated permease PerM